MHDTRSMFKPETLLHMARRAFNSVYLNDGKDYAIPTVDCLMSGLAIFHLKYPSLLQFENERSHEKQVRHNIQTLYGVHRIPCDTQLRERLDDSHFLKPIRVALQSYIRSLQRTKALESMKFLDDYYLISGDATGFFSSHDIKCDHCCTKVHNKGKPNESTSYHHHMLVGCLVHPDKRTVLPIGFEPIERFDGSRKNDCEQNAGKRWIDRFRQTHPKLKVIFLGDGLYSRGPFIQKLKEKNMSYLLVAKQDDHKALYDYFWAADEEDAHEFTCTRDHLINRYRFVKDVPLNDTYPDLLVTVIYNEETNTHTNTTIKRVWVTDLKVTKENVVQLVKGARTRWKIENETFNALKNKGYHFEHNYGHGYKGLANVFAGLMLLAFLIDQIMEAFNKTFQAVMKRYHSRTNFWGKYRAFFLFYLLSSWDAYYASMLDPPIHAV